MTLLLAVPAAIFLGVLLWDLTRSPSVRRLAMRRARRRPADALFVVLGSLLATTIISASFFVGDTLNGSIRDLARTQYGPADEAVVATGLETVPALETALADPVPGTDGLLTVVSAPVTATHVARDGDRRSQALAQAHEVAVPEARRFGGDETATGFAGIDDSPERGEALVGEDLAADLAVRRGDNLEVFAYGRQIDVEVTTILPRLGVAGFYPSAGSRSPVLFLAPGTLEAAIAGELVPVPPTVRVLVSN
ncbi:MAG: hypothetical protein H0U89_02975, partial [Acidimicrobiia bacterium]|nr:hypothetical protein [Acidimicrobiia bacterium]